MWLQHIVVTEPEVVCAIRNVHVFWELGIRQQVQRDV